MGITDWFTGPYYATKYFITGGYLAKSIVKQMIDEQLVDADKVSKNMLTDVYVFDQIGFFQRDTTLHRYDDVVYMTSGGYYAVLNAYMQKALKDAHQYMYFAGNKILRSDKIGVRLTYSDVALVRAIAASGFKNYNEPRRAFEERIIKMVNTIDQLERQAERIRQIALREKADYEKAHGVRDGAGREDSHIAPPPQGDALAEATRANASVRHGDMHVANNSEVVFNGQNRHNEYENSVRSLEEHHGGHTPPPRDQSTPVDLTVNSARSPILTRVTEALGIEIPKK